MREIKFRGESKDSGQWVIGYYVKHEKRQVCPIGDDELSDDEIECLIVYDDFADWNMPKNLVCKKVDPETVGQNTGLKDKNGIEIYEGDIVKYQYCGKIFIDEVKFGEGAFYVQNKTYNPRNILDRGYIYKVIGNIHDNPELLEVQE